MILVLGMHRSGTSALTALLAAMGAYIGAPAELLEASPDNPEGFFERKDALNANRAILSAQNCNWYEVDDFDAKRPVSENISRELGRITANLENRMPAALKDPRLCLTLPYWSPYIKKPVIVLAIRNPAAIAHSLFLRNNMPLEKGLALWEQYTRQALRNTASLPVIRCHYEDLVAQPESTAEALHFALSAIYPGLKLPERSVIKPALTRANNTHIKLTPAQRDLYTKLQGL